MTLGSLIRPLLRNLRRGSGRHYGVSIRTGFRDRAFSFKLRSPSLVPDRRGVIGFTAIIRPFRAGPVALHGREVRCHRSPGVQSLLPSCFNRSLRLGIISVRVPTPIIRRRRIGTQCPLGSGLNRTAMVLCISPVGGQLPVVRRLHAGAQSTAGIRCNGAVISLRASLLCQGPVVIGKVTAAPSVPEREFTGPASRSAVPHTSRRHIP